MSAERSKQAERNQRQGKGCVSPRPPRQSPPLGSSLERLRRPLHRLTARDLARQAMAPNPYVKALAPGSAAAAGGSPAAASKRKERRKSASTGTTAADSPAKGKGKARADDSALRAEILALGGAEDDLDLLDGVDSESEVEGDEPAGASKGDVRAFLGYRRGLRC